MMLYCRLVNNNTLYTLCGDFIIRMEEIAGIKIAPKTSFKVNLQNLSINTDCILDVICYYSKDKSTGSIIRDGVSVSWHDTELNISTAANEINKVKILYVESVK